MYNEEARTNWSHYSPCQVKSIDTIDNIIAYRLINTYVVDGIRSIVSSFREQTARGSCAHIYSVGLWSSIMKQAVEILLFSLLFAPEAWTGSL